MTDSLAQPLVDAAATAGDDLTHYFCCCDENTAICGVDLTTVPVTDDEEHVCPLCVLADEDSCPRCGE